MNKLFKGLSAFALGIGLSFGVVVGTTANKRSVAKAGESIVDVCDFTTMKSKNSSYGNKWTYDNKYTVYGGANNNGKWEYVKFGAKKQSAESPDKITEAYVIFPKQSSNVGKISLSTKAMSLKGVVTWSVDVSPNEDFSNATNYDGGTIDVKTSVTYTITPPTAVEANMYYRVNINCTNKTTDNGLVGVNDIRLINISEGPIALESIEASDVAILPGQVGQSEITYTPEDADNKEVTYEITQGTDVASVDKDGNIVGLKSGTATLKVTSTEEGVEPVYATVTVNSYPPVESVVVGKKYVITGSNESDKYELSGVSGNLGSATQYTGSPANLYVLDVVDGLYENTVAFKNGDNYLSFTGTGNNLYTSTELNAASSWTVCVETTDLVVRNVGDNTRVLSFNYSSGTPRFACYGNLNQRRVEFVEYVTGIDLESFSFASEMTMRVGNKVTVQVTYVPVNASDKSLTWTSSEESIVTVSNGVVTAVGEGSATITAVHKGLNPVSCSVTVIPATEHAGTEQDPYSIADAVNVANGAPGVKTGAYVKGIVTKFISGSSATKCSFWVGDNMSQTSADTGAFEFFQLADISDETFKLIKVGATVVGCGNITLYSSKTAEFEKGGRLTYNSYGEANAVAKTFNTSLTSICEVTQGNAGGFASSQLVELFDSGEDLIKNLTEVEKAHFAGESKTGDNATDLEKMLATYDYCMSKYSNLNNFLGRSVTPGSDANSVVLEVNNSSSSTILIIVVVVSSLSLAALCLARRKKCSK